jgi:integrase
MPTDEAWRDLKKFPKVAQARTHHFSLDEVRRLIAKADSLAFQQFLEAGFLTGARAGELRELDVQHFNAATGQLYVAAERAGAKKTGPRSIALTTEGEAFFSALVQGRKPDAPLLVNPNGERWPVGGHKKPMKRALVAAGLYRKDSRGNAPTYYSTRHTVISRTRETGMPDWLLARNCGTSPKMIEDTYGKISPETQRAMVEQFTPKLHVVPRDVA